MNVLSLFDGCAMARVALDRIGINCTYYASEIDMYAIKVAQKNYPDIIHLGDIRQISGFTLPKINLIVGGSPCQDLSGAGRGKGLEGERSGLFFDYVRLLRYLKPKYFLLENVASMSKQNRFIISQHLGVEPVEIDSALVSAQSRKRLYWTNIQGIGQPEDKGILLRDVIEDGVVDRDKSYCIDANYWKGTTIRHYAAYHRRQVVFEDEQARDIFQKTVQRIGNLKGSNGRAARIYSIEGKSVALSASTGGWGTSTGLYYINDHVRKLTPVECERLQTLPDNYTEGVSNTQRYKMLGNGFTVDVIAHILSHMEKRE